MRLLIFIPSYGSGGVERMVVNTARGLSARGVEVLFMTGNPNGPYLDNLPPEVRIIPFPKSGWARQVLRLHRWLRKHPVDWILAGKLADGSVAVTAKRIGRHRVNVLLRPGTAVMERLRHRRWWQRRLKLGRLRRVYRHANAIVANSEGVRANIAEAAGLPEQNIELIRNPVIVPEFHRLADKPLDDPWLRDGSIPTVIGVGALRRQKGFDNLIAAFATVRRERPCRLIILGEGNARETLEAQVRELGLLEDVRLPGFVPNPYPYIKHANVFVLSSWWEGSPNVLTEALALGVSVISTDCPSGPREILADGALAPLVPVGDVAALASAIATVLDKPLDSNALRGAAEAYTMEANAAAYEAVLRRSLR